MARKVVMLPSWKLHPLSHLPFVLQHGAGTTDGRACTSLFTKLYVGNVNFIYYFYFNWSAVRVHPVDLFLFRGTCDVIALSQDWKQSTVLIQTANLLTNMCQEFSLNQMSTFHWTNIHTSTNFKAYREVFLKSPHKFFFFCTEMMHMTRDDNKIITACFRTQEEVR